MGVLTSGHSTRYFLNKTFLLGVAKVAMVAMAKHRADLSLELPGSATGAVYRTLSVLVSPVAACGRSC